MSQKPKAFVLCVDEKASLDNAELTRNRFSPFAEVELWVSKRIRKLSEVPEWYRGWARKKRPECWGNYKAHVDVLAEAHERKLPEVLILEDDADPKPGFGEKFKEAMNIIDLCEVFFMGHYGPGRKLSFPLTNGMCRIGGVIWGVHCYLVNHSVMKPLSEFRMKENSDIMISKALKDLEIEAMAFRESYASQRPKLSMLRGIRVGRKGK